MGDWRRALLRHCDYARQPDCDELAATTGQTALGNDGKNASKKSFVVTKETSSQVGIPFEVWLPAVDTLRNLFCAPTVKMTITVDRLAQDRYAIY
jgi:hypothetical protein